MAERHVVAWTVAASFAFAAVFLSFLQIWKHIKHNHHALLRKYVVRILLMVPVYSIESWFALYNSRSALGKYLVLLRDTYESVVIYSFFMMLLSLLGGERCLSRRLESRGGVVTHIFPAYYWWDDWPLNKSFVTRTRDGTLQYCIIKPAVALVQFISDEFGILGEGSLSLSSVHLYTTLINNVSQAYAMYCLIMLYKATKHDLAAFKPLPKFLCVKGVVFFTFWQDVLIIILAHLGIIKPTFSYSVSSIELGLQSFIICIEMFLFSVAHLFAFRLSEFSSEKIAASTTGPATNSFMQLVDARVRSDQHDNDGDGGPRTIEMKHMGDNGHQFEEEQQNSQINMSAGSASSQSKIQRLWHAVNVTDVYIQDAKSLFVRKKSQSTHVALLDDADDDVLDSNL